MNKKKRKGKKKKSLPYIAITLSISKENNITVQEFYIYNAHSIFIALVLLKYLILFLFFSYAWFTLFKQSNAVI